MASTGVFTDTFREKFAELTGGQLVSPTQEQMAISWFVVGEGGYQTVSGGTAPKVPNASRTDIEATIDSTLPTGESSTGARFAKALQPSDVTVNGKDIQVVCVLDANEADLDLHSHLTGNLNGNPRIHEIGIFDGDPSSQPSTMIAYCTLDSIIKQAGRRVQITVNISF